MHICLPADESTHEVTYEIQDDAYGLVDAADCNNWVWRGAFPGGQVDPVVGWDISNPLEIEACNPVTGRSHAPSRDRILLSPIQLDESGLRGGCPPYLVFM
jgi:hypothetical protein